MLIALVSGQGLQAAAQWWTAGAAHGGAYDPEHAYRFGLQRVLDGLAVLIDRRS